MQTEKLDIQYDFAASSLGLVLVAITKDGICQITVDDDKESQIEHLHKNFPKAKR